MTTVYGVAGSNAVEPPINGREILVKRRLTSISRGLAAASTADRPGRT
jgi:hypothetical protein